MAPKNLSFILEKAGQVKYEDRPIPKLSSPYDVLVNVKRTGICGSDVHYWVHGAIGPFVVKDPMVLGHESSGVIAEVGSAVTTLKPGDRVAMEPGVPCRRCVRCKEGGYNLCPDMKFAATPPYDGTLAKYYVLPEDFCYKLGDNMSLEEGAMVEPLSVAIHVSRQGQIKPGQSVVIFGAGPIGLLCCGVAKALGAKKIIAVDIQEQRLEFAKKYAATGSYISAKVPATENAENIKKEFDLGNGADVAIDASGVEPSIQTGIHVLRSGGTYVQAGNGKPDVVFPIMAMSNKEITTKSSFRYSTGDYQLAVDLLSSGRLSVKELITNQYPFLEAEKAFEETKGGKGVKIIIEGPEE
ncbi:putative D-xylulose reductase A [Xylona heveae TC161]|uniref:D-xylulose reductase n=1 Tax=Xylona heveae (strain CBS 132557 / TC161) TaxID=1328760 RepID=A0A165GBI8_XYLHT|nr:putative D-xylulose reductase A [Xylona heveae TC161]KZF21989.1 putative D-xylulose reductase A [Xylona heveae TC161]